MFLVECWYFGICASVCGPRAISTIPALVQKLDFRSSIFEVDQIARTKFNTVPATKPRYASVSIYDHPVMWVILSAPFQALLEQLLRLLCSFASQFTMLSSDFSVNLISNRMSYS